MSRATPEQAQALRQIVSAVTDTVREAGPLGAPGGVLYAALTVHGCTLNQFESLMGGLVNCGRLVKDGDCYRVRT